MKQDLELVSRPTVLATPWEKEAYDGIDGALDDIYTALGSMQEDGDV